MPKSKKLQKQIEKKLEKLHELIDKFDEARIVDSDDPETWDSDILYKLVENLKETLKVLEDKKHPKEKDPWGEPVVLEEGLCSLIDEYHNEEESEEF